MTLTPPNPGWISKLSFPEHGQPELFGIEYDVHSSRVTNPNTPFSNARVGTPQHDRFIRSQQLDRLAFQPARCSRLPTVRKVRPPHNVCIGRHHPTEARTRKRRRAGSEVRNRGVVH